MQTVSPAQAKQTSSAAQPAFFRPRRLGHVNLWAKDIKRSERFYNDVCGLAVEFWEPDLVATFLGTGNTPHDLGMIEITGGKARYGRDGLLQIPEGIGTETGLGHIAWELENEAELVEGYGRVKAANVPIIMTVDHQVAHSVYMPDPDGNQVEFYCDTVKDWREVLRGEMSLITGSWTPGETEPFTDPRYDENPEIRMVERAPVHPRRVTHTVLVTQDIKRLGEYYARVGGMTEVWRARDGSVVCLRGSHPDYRYHLALCDASLGSRPGYHHIAFELGNPKDVEDAERAVRARGLAPEFIVDHTSKRSFFLRDPDGMRIEFYARRKDEFVDLANEPRDRIAYLI